MKCEELLRILGDYIDGEVDGHLCQAFEEHLSQCDPCQVVIDNIRKTITLYRAGQPLEMPQEIRERLHQILRDRWKDRSWKK